MHLSGKFAATRNCTCFMPISELMARPMRTQKHKYVNLKILVSYNIRLSPRAHTQTLTCKSIICHYLSDAYTTDDIHSLHFGKNIVRVMPSLELKQTNNNKIIILRSSEEYQFNIFASCTVYLYLEMNTRIFWIHFFRESRVKFNHSFHHAIWKYYDILRFFHLI